VRKRFVIVKTKTMSADNKTSVTVSYRKRGLGPPVFVAGSFSDPKWEPQEMHCVIDESGEHHFTIQIPVEPGRQYHYKFKLGSRDDWVLDEHATLGSFHSNMPHDPSWTAVEL
jgi:hypothetical protein